ncbi:hypothetical protein PMALA_039760 [Plasmodium malariae]|uniref:Early transcribed membrane protein n=1 Tax=Plasmodium malariae TaxID=5858 RepID=A0A1A8WNQ3_PLAMA|nr:hypothetical protein PMALA_039760 [Plasmodium malariae]
MECRSSQELTPSQNVNRVKVFEERMKNLSKKKKLVIAATVLGACLLVGSLIGGVSYGYIRHKRKKDMEDEEFIHIESPVRNRDSRTDNEKKCKGEKIVHFYEGPPKSGTIKKDQDILGNADIPKESSAYDSDEDIFVDA